MVQTGYFIRQTSIQKQRKYRHSKNVIVLLHVKAGGLSQFLVITKTDNIKHHINFPGREWVVVMI